MATSIPEDVVDPTLAFSDDEVHHLGHWRRLSTPASGARQLQLSCETTQPATAAATPTRTCAQAAIDITDRFTLQRRIIPMACSVTPPQSVSNALLAPVASSVASCAALARLARKTTLASKGFAKCACLRHNCLWTYAARSAPSCCSMSAPPSSLWRRQLLLRWAGARHLREPAPQRRLTFPSSNPCCL